MNKMIEAEVAVLVYDITRKSSFDDIQNYWISQTKLFSKENLSNI